MSSAEKLAALADDAPQPNRAELVSAVCEIIENVTADPAAEMRAQAEALLRIADALEGMSPRDAKATIRAVREMML